MAIMSKFLIFTAALAVADATGAAESLHINISAVDGVRQTVNVNRTLPQRFIARVTLDDGTPLAGVNLRFAVNGCLVPATNSPGTPSCPNPAVYGHFTSGTQPVVTTDAEGRAMSPEFVAGSLGGSYSVFVSQADWSQKINGKTLMGVPQALPNLFQVKQIAAAISSVPLFSVSAVLVLAGLLGLAAFWHRRRGEAA